MLELDIWDYGYAVTSHSSQGVSADRVLVHVDTKQAHERFINSRLAYVSVRCADLYERCPEP